LLASTPVANGLLYFAADDGVHGQELWVSDGTAGGTHMVLDIHPTGSSNPFNFVPFGTGILFSADDGTHGLELWKSDGTAGGTVLVKDVVPGAGFYNIREIVPADTQAFFNANDGTHGDELWVTDGTTAGTQLVRDIQPGSDSSFSFWLPSLLGAVGNRAIFFADDGVHGLEPWASDGTEAGTVPLADVNPGSGSSMISLLVLDHALTVGSRLYFRAFTDQDGAEVWTSDGTPAGTTKLKEINDQTSSFFFFGGKLFGPALGALPGGKVLFQADDAGGTGFEPWASDGTAAGTQRIADLWPGAESSYPTSMAPLNGKVLFLADANPSPSNPGLWISDGTAAGTTLLASGINAWPPLAPLGGIALMDGPGPDYAIWKTDGTPAGTGPVGPAVTIQGATSVLGATLLFQGYTTSGAQPGLWQTDGSAAGTGLVHSFSESSWLTLAPASGNRLFFSADTNAEGRELWVTDGTPAGTVLVEDLNPGPASGAGDWLAPLGTSIVFTGDDGTTGPEPWISDGTPAGTQLLADIVAGTGGSHPTDLTSAGGRVYFVADDGTHGRELWVTDGTPTGTTLFDLEPGAGSSLPTDLTAIGRVLAFSAWDQADGRELWVSDGTAAGTHRVQDIAPGPLSSSPTGITLSDKTVYFVANDNTHGFELWSVPKVDLDGLQDFYTVTPCRIVDTRATAPLPSGFAQTVTVAGLCSIPATAHAVAANVTILDATGGGHLTLWPSGTQEPGTSILNFDPGMTRANNAILSLGGGAVDVRPTIAGNGSVQVVIDVSGYFQ
jgi:ELWxxDGT repeat protein